MVLTLQLIKPQAKESINHVAQNHNNEIDLNNNATTEEKDDAKEFSKCSNY